MGAQSMLRQHAARLLPNWHPRIIAVLAILLTLLFTYVSTSLQSLSTRHFRPRNAQPPLVPYWVPFVGNTVSFAANTRSYIASLL